jgi:hypothetical protein
MKKLSLLLIVFLLIGSFAFAQDDDMEEMAPVAPALGTDVEATIDGEASVTFGALLPENGLPLAAGFKNSASSSIELAIVPESDASSGAVGIIQLNDFEISVDSEEDEPLIVEAPSVTAMLMFAPVTVTIYSAPEFDAGNAESYADIIDDTINDDDDARDAAKVALSNGNTSSAATTEDETEDEVIFVPTGSTPPEGATLIETLDTGGVYELAVTTTSDVDAEDATFQGITVSLALDPVTVDLMVASDGSWDNEPREAGNINDYAFGVGVSGGMMGINANAAGFFGPTDYLDIGTTLGIDGGFGPLTFDVGYDTFLPQGGEFLLDTQWDLSLGLGVSIAGISASTLTYFYQGEGGALELEQEVALDLSGLVEPLTVTAAVHLTDVLSEVNFGTAVSVAYAIGGIKPYADVAFVQPADEVEVVNGEEVVEESESVVDLTAGVELTGFVENTTFTLQYAAEDYWRNDSGAITFETKIAY